MPGTTITIATATSTATGTITTMITLTTTITTRAVDRITVPSSPCSRSCYYLSRPSCPSYIPS